MSFVDRGRKAEDIDGIPDLRGKTILIAEDAAAHRALLSAMLEPTGARIVVAADGIEALAACERDLPDLLLLDIDMPAMHGPGVARKLRQSGATLPIIALTGYAASGDAAMGLGAGTDAYLAKPFRIDSLYALLVQHLNRVAAAE